jgi:hypothetical protein
LQEPEAAKALASIADTMFNLKELRITAGNNINKDTNAASLVALGKFSNVSEVVLFGRYPSSWLDFLRGKYDVPVIDSH